MDHSTMHSEEGVSVNYDQISIAFKAHLVKRCYSAGTYSESMERVAFVVFVHFSHYIGCHTRTHGCS